MSTTTHVVRTPGDAGPGPAGPRVLSRVLLVSDDPRFLACWGANLRRQGAARSVEACPAGAPTTALDALAAPADLVVVDADAFAGGPPGSGRGPSQVTRRSPHTVVVGDPGRGATVSAALASGARGFLFGRATVAEPVLVPAATPSAAGTVQVLDLGGVPCTLTDREVQIIRYTADGESNMEIATRLGLSPLTVKSHLARIGRRLGTGDRAQIVLLALRSGAFS